MIEVMDQVREKIFDFVTDPPCRICEFWDVRGHYCWLKNMHPNSKKCELMNQILSIHEIFIKDPDQSLPKIPFNYEDECREYTSYSKGQQDMKNKENWVKVLKEKK